MTIPAAEIQAVSDILRARFFAAVEENPDVDPDTLAERMSSALSRTWRRGGDIDAWAERAWALMISE